jgi:catecholate siderophore receptor
MPYPRLTGTLAIVAACVSICAHAQTRELHIPSGDLKTALDQYALQSGVQLLYNADDVKGLSTKGVDGALPQDQAMAALLDNSGLSMKRDGAGGVVLFRDATPAEAPVDEVVVTGTAAKHTKIQTSYSITTINEETLRMQAPTSVTEALKSVPGFWVEASGGEASRCNTIRRWVI